jgi:hypothetical protein
VLRRVLPAPIPSTFFLLFLLFLSPRHASAQVTPTAGYVPPDDTQVIRIGAVIFYDYTYTKSPKLMDAAGNPFSPSSFNVARTYINVTGNISHIVSFRITPDISREAGTGSTLTGSLTFRLKYGYAQFLLDEWTGGWRQTWVRLGMQQTPFIDAQESAYRYRFQGTTFIERDGGLSSADTGATFHTNIPKNYGDFHFGFYNGEGYNRAETNGQKAFMFRGTVRPLPTSDMQLRGLRLTGGYIADSYVPNAERTRGMFNALYEHRRFNAGFDYITLHDQPLPTATKVNAGGWSFWATPFFKERGNGFEALIRYDDYEPNKANNNQHRKRTIAGVAFWFPHPGGAPVAALLFDFEQVKFDNFPSTPVNATQQRYTLHGLINF